MSHNHDLLSPRKRLETYRPGGGALGICRARGRPARAARIKRFQNGWGLARFWAFSAAKWECPHLWSRFEIVLRWPRTRFNTLAAPALTAVIVGLAFSFPVPRAVVRAQEAKAEKSGNADLGAGAVHSLLAVIPEKPEQQAQPVVVLSRPAYGGLSDKKEDISQEMLPRELARQALLIAARDELGLSTRDEVIDDYWADEKKAPPACAEVLSSILQERWHARVNRVGKDQTERLMDYATQASKDHIADLLKLTIAAEALSRQEFPGVLKRLGLAGKANDRKETTEPALPRYAGGRLSSLGYSQTLGAIRDLHQAIRTKGETPAALGALVRGYAQLGVLSEFHWHPAHKVFKARALLYGQRLLAHDPDRPWSLWHRAFALALVGRHREALADLESAGKHAGAAKDAPAWVELIDAYVRCDTRRLEDHKGPGENLAALLRMITLEYPSGKAINLAAAKTVVELDPLCFRAHDAMCHLQGVNAQHTSTLLGPTVLEQGFAEDLATLESLPASVRNRLGPQLPIRELADLLQKAGQPEYDRGEPSWSALAHLVRETRFVQVWRRLNFMKVMWSVPVDDYWKEVKADVASHRYRPYLETLALPSHLSYPAFGQFAEHVDLSDIERTQGAMITFLSRYQTDRAKAALAVANSHADFVASTRADFLINARKEDRLRYAGLLMDVSPNHPLARATMIELAWDKVKDKVDEWEKQSADNPSILAALGQHAFNAKNYDEARRLLKRYIEQSPDLWGYQMVADSFKAQGDMDHWRETLDDFLNKVEDLNLDHPKVRVAIAEYFMSRNEWDKATVYAEDAAESWAGWAMDCAARCAEGAKNWDQAETWHQRISERYPDQDFAHWYFFCKRTGHGNLAAAREFTEQYIHSPDCNPDFRNTYEGCFYWLDGQKDKARQAYSRSRQKSFPLGDALGLAVLFDEAGDTALRNDLLKEVAAKSKGAYPKLIDALQLVMDTVLEPAGQKKPFDPKELDGRIEACPLYHRTFAQFFSAGLLKNHGQVAQARSLYERCADSNALWEWYRLIAKDVLKSMKDK
jgi:tetratricopeptide (TPR) repeat protein